MRTEQAQPATEQAVAEAAVAEAVERTRRVSRPKPPSFSVFRALVLRDLTVMDKSLGEFLHHTITQPLLLVFVFTFVLPKIGQGMGGGTEAGASRFASLLMAGLIAQAMAFVGIFRVAVPLAREIDVTNELEGRMLAPTSVYSIGFERILFGAVVSAFAALVVFPIAAYLPATPVFLLIDWPILLTVVPLACYASAALGLALGTVLKPSSVPLLAGTLALPLAFGGAIFYTWDSLDALPWLKVLVLFNPITYMSEGMRAALFTGVGVDHMPLPIVYGALLTFSVTLTIVGLRGFKKRVMF